MTLAEATGTELGEDVHSAKDVSGGGGGLEGGGEERADGTGGCADRGMQRVVLVWVDGRADGGSGIESG